MTLCPTWEYRRAQLFTGDCLDVLPTLPPASLDCVVTSPPYAEQRKGFYDGVPEGQYPEWTVAWMAALRPALKERGSVLVNIREHGVDGQISDYVHRTRLAVRAAGWRECDELIWDKGSGPPIGHKFRPRRSWERILWFSPSRDPWCDLYVEGLPNHTGRPKGPGPLAAQTWDPWQWKKIRPHARSIDIVRVDTGGGDGGHVAAYPVALARWLLALFCPPDGVACDPFNGSGTTGLAALRLGMGYVGIEKQPDQVAASVARLRGAASQASVFDAGEEEAV